MEPSFERPESDRSDGLSLVELLVVLAVIATLLMLFFPALGRMRDASREVVCMGNLRAYGSAVLTYAAENNGLPAWNGLGPGDQTGGSTYPNFDSWLIPRYLAAKLRCPLMTNAEEKLTTGFRYGGSAALAQHYPRLKGIPAPAHRVVLALESYGSSFWSPTHLNMTMWGVSDANAKDERTRIHEGSVRRPQFHGTRENRGLNLLFLDGHAALVRPVKGDWYQKPTYGDATNGGDFYDRVQFGNMKNGKLEVR